MVRLAGTWPLKIAPQAYGTTALHDGVVFIDCKHAGQTRCRRRPSSHSSAIARSPGDLVCPTIHSSRPTAPPHSAHRLPHPKQDGLSTRLQHCRIPEGRLRPEKRIASVGRRARAVQPKRCPAHAAKPLPPAPPGDPDARIDPESTRRDRRRRQRHTTPTDRVLCVYRGLYSQYQGIISSTQYQQRARGWRRRYATPTCRGWRIAERLHLLETMDERQTLAAEYKLVLQLAVSLNARPTLDEFAKAVAAAGIQLNQPLLEVVHSQEHEEMAAPLALAAFTRLIIRNGRNNFVYHEVFDDVLNTHFIRRAATPIGEVDEDEEAERPSSNSSGFSARRDRLSCMFATPRSFVLTRSRSRAKSGSRPLQEKKLQLAFAKQGRRAHAERRRNILPQQAAAFANGVPRATLTDAELQGLLAEAGVPAHTSSTTVQPSQQPPETAPTPARFFLMILNISNEPSGNGFAHPKSQLASTTSRMISLTITEPTSIAIQKDSAIYCKTTQTDDDRIGHADFSDGSQDLCFDDDMMPYRQSHDDSQLFSKWPADTFLIHGRYKTIETVIHEPERDQPNPGIRVHIANGMARHPWLPWIRVRIIRHRNGTFYPNFVCSYCELEANAPPGEFRYQPEIALRMAGGSDAQYRLLDKLTRGARSRELFPYQAPPQFTAMPMFRRGNLVIHPEFGPQSRMGERYFEMGSWMWPGLQPDQTYLFWPGLRPGEYLDVYLDAFQKLINCPVVRLMQCYQNETECIQALPAIQQLFENILKAPRIDREDGRRLVIIDIQILVTEFRTEDRLRVWDKAVLPHLSIEYEKMVQVVWALMDSLRPIDIQLYQADLPKLSIKCQPIRTPTCANLIIAQNYASPWQVYAQILQSNTKDPRDTMPPLRCLWPRPIDHAI
ncbi:unnamed protein product, partial [Mesorhabditis spiculigera]